MISGAVVARYARRVLQGQIPARGIYVRCLRGDCTGAISTAARLWFEFRGTSDTATAALAANSSTPWSGCGGARPTRDNAPTLCTAGRLWPKVAESSDKRERECECELRHRNGQNIAQVLQT